MVGSFPPPPPPIVNLDGWAQWPDPQAEEIDENELHLVNDLADAGLLMLLLMV
jgi:hypothetical protein